MLQGTTDNEPLCDSDWNELESIFWNEVGTEKEFEAVANGVSLGRFIRGITGLSKEAALSAFSEFLDKGLFTEAQITFVHHIVDWLTKWGTVTSDDMKDDEFAGGADILEIFAYNLEALQRIKQVVDSINNNALRVAS